MPVWQGMLVYKLTEPTRQRARRDTRIPGHRVFPAPPITAKTAPAYPAGQVIAAHLDGFICSRSDSPCVQSKNSPSFSFPHIRRGQPYGTGNPGTAPGPAGPQDPASGAARQSPPRSSPGTPGPGRGQVWLPLAAGGLFALSAAAATVSYGARYRLVDAAQHSAIGVSGRSQDPADQITGPPVQSPCRRASLGELTDPYGPAQQMVSRLRGCAGRCGSGTGRRGKDHGRSPCRCGKGVVDAGAAVYGLWRS